MVTLNGEGIFDDVARTYQAEAAKAGRQLALGEDSVRGFGVVPGRYPGGSYTPRGTLP